MVIAVAASQPLDAMGNRCLPIVVLTGTMIVSLPTQCMTQEGCSSKRRYLTQIP